MRDSGQGLAEVSQMPGGVADGVQFFVQDVFGCTVDLVTEKGLRAELRPFIENEAVHV